MTTSPDQQQIRRSEPRDDVRVTFPDGVVLSGDRGATFGSYVSAWQAEVGSAEPPVVAVIHDGVIRELTYAPSGDTEVVPLPITNNDGMRIYSRSLSMVLVVAAKRLFPEATVNIDHSVTANGVFCTVTGRPPLSVEEVTALEVEMAELVRRDLPITRRPIPLSEAIAVFARQNYQDKVRLLRFHPSTEIEVYELAGLINTFYGHLVPRTRYLKRFRLQHVEGGFMLLFPLIEDPERFAEETSFPKLLRQFRRAVEWLHTVGAEDVGALNAAIERDSLRELILVAEALHERRIAEIAVRIASRPDVRIVFIAGPTSSGKTTFAKRLGIQLAASGLRSFAVALDDYFVDRALTPRDELGELDFESIEAVDTALFNDHMQRLLEGGMVRLPRYDFPSGTSVPGRDVALPPGTVLLVEGLHGLNPSLLPGARPSALFRVYVSCLAQINIDHHNHIPTSDSRLLRRLVRDAYFRGYTAEETIVRWQSVRRGERRFVFPYQEQADMMFNTALAYEMAVLKPVAEPLLMPYDHDSPASIEVQRLLGMLEHFLPADMGMVPDNSLLREFIGGSILQEVELSGSVRP